MNRAYLSYIHYIHSNHEYFWRAYELNEYIHKICMHSLLRPLSSTTYTGDTQEHTTAIEEQLAVEEQPAVKERPARQKRR